MSQKSNDTDLAALWQAYQNVSFHWLEAPLESPAFGVITAWNPHSHPLGTSQNQLRQQQLIEQIVQAGCAWKALKVGDPRMRYWEHSLAVAMPREPLMLLAEGWHQNAMYWVENGTVSLLPLSSMPAHAPLVMGAWADYRFIPSGG